MEHRFEVEYISKGMKKSKEAEISQQIQDTSKWFNNKEILFSWIY